MYNVTTLFYTVMVLTRHLQCCHSLMILWLWFCSKYSKTSHTCLMLVNQNTFCHSRLRPQSSIRLQIFLSLGGWLSREIGETAVAASLAFLSPPPPPPHPKCCCISTKEEAWEGETKAARITSHPSVRRETGARGEAWPWDASLAVRADIHVASLYRGVNVHLQ